MHHARPCKHRGAFLLYGVRLPRRRTKRTQGIDYALKQFQALEKAGKGLKMITPYNAQCKRNRRRRGFSITWKAKPIFYVVYKVHTDGTREAVNEFQNIVEARYFKREMELCFNGNYVIVGAGFTYV